MKVDLACMLTEALRCGQLERCRPARPEQDAAESRKLEYPNPAPHSPDLSGRRRLASNLPGMEGAGGGGAKAEAGALVDTQRDPTVGIQEAGEKVRQAKPRRCGYWRADGGEGRTSDLCFPLSVRRRVGVIWVWRAPIGVIPIWTARGRPNCCRVSFGIPCPRNHFSWRLRPSNRTLRKSRLLDNLLSAKTIPILPVRLLRLKVLPIIPNFNCMTGHWGTQQQNRRHNQQHVLHFTPPHFPSCLDTG